MNNPKGFVWGSSYEEILVVLVCRILSEGWQTSEIADHEDFLFIQKCALEAKNLMDNLN